MDKSGVAMLLIVVVAFAISLYFYPQLPEEMATHWNARGEVDGHMSRFWGTFLLPFITLGLVGLFLVLPKVDPLKRNYPVFKKYYYGVVILVLVFMLYVHVVSLAANLGFSFNMSYVMLFPLALLFLFMGLILPKVRRNWFMGIRTPWTLSSEKVWVKTHEVGGKLFVAYGIFLLVMLLFYDLVADYFTWIVIGPVLLLVAFTFVYSYYEYWKETGKKKK